MDIELPRCKKSSTEAVEPKRDMPKEETLDPRRVNERRLKLEPIKLSSKRDAEDPKRTKERIDKVEPIFIPSKSEV